MRRRSETFYDFTPGHRLGIYDMVRYSHRGGDRYRAICVGGNRKNLRIRVYNLPPPVVINVNHFL